MDGMNSLWQWLNTLCGNSVAKEVNGLCTENTLGYVNNKTVFCKSLEEETQVASMLLGVGAGNENIIDVYEEEFLEAATNYH